MRRRAFLARIVCLCLVLFYGMSACSPFRRYDNTGAQTYTSSNVRPATKQEFPEIEIPFGTDIAETGMPQNTVQSANELPSPAVPTPTPMNSTVPELELVFEADNSGTNDVHSYDNGDIMLPEAP